MTGIHERPLTPVLPRVEQHGIDLIATSERWATPRDLCALWAGASFQVEYFVYGIALMTFGFSLSQALILTVIGNLSFLLVGVASLQGPVAGTTAMTINRAPFGARGARIIALFNWLTQIGFETEGLILVVLAGEVLATRAHWHLSVATKLSLVVIATLLQLLLPLFGHAALVRVLRILIVPFIALYLLLAFEIAPKTALHHIGGHASWATWLAGLAFTIALSGLGWTENGNDYSRYLPEDVSRRRVVGWVFLGSGVPQILVMALGIMIGTKTTTIATAANPFDALANAALVPTGLVVPVLVVAIAQLFAINSLDLYSSGVTLQTVGLRLRRWQAVIVDTIVTGTLTAIAIFNASFSTLLKDFADVVIIWIGPWVAIYLVDWYRRGYRYDREALQRTDRSGRYFGRFGGFSLSALVAQLVGMIAAVEGLAPTFALPHWMILFTTHTGGADISVFSGTLVAGALYWFATRPGSRWGDEVAGDRMPTSG